MVVPTPVVTQSEIDGIPTFSVDGPRPFTAALEFRVGVYDERLPERGITHLVEHLALYSHRETEIAYNGSVGPHLTTFWAQGHPDEVGAFLRDVATSIHELPLDRLMIEAEILLREEAMTGSTHVDRILTSYFGPFGPGAASALQFGLDWLGPEEITSWATRHFTADNAALVIVGESADTWGIELPAGQPVYYELPERVRAAPESPTLLDVQEHGVTWGALMRDRKGTVEPELMIALEIVAKRLEDRLRHDLGRTYSVFRGWERLDENHLMASHGFDANPEYSREAALEHQRILQEFIASGPSQEEIDRFVRIQAKSIEDHPQEFAGHRVTAVAEAHLQGWNRTIEYAEWKEACAAATPEAVRARLEEAHRQSFTVADLPLGTLATFNNVTEVSEAPMRGVEYRIRKTPWRIEAGHPTAIRFGPDGISTLWSDGWLLERIDDIAMVSFKGGLVSIIASHTEISVETRKYRKTRYQTSIPWSAGAAFLILAIVGVVLLFEGTWLFLVPWVVAGVIGASNVVHDSSLLKNRTRTVEEVAASFLPEDVLLPSRAAPDPTTTTRI
jgi:zinc protease